jgi:hypothetical protein
MFNKQLNSLQHFAFERAVDYSRIVNPSSDLNGMHDLQSIHLEAIIIPLT